MGAARRLLIAGEIEEVLALEDASLLEAANPIGPDGSVQQDPERVRAGQDAHVKAILHQGGVAAIILGGGHDLSASVGASSPKRFEYRLLTTKRFWEFAISEY